MFAREKHPLVDCDLEEAALWYAARDGQVAERFVSACEDAIRELVRGPLRHRERFENIRRANLVGFPYGVFFFVHAETVYILAVLHAARDHRAAIERRPEAP